MSPPQPAVIYRDFYLKFVSALILEDKDLQSKGWESPGDYLETFDLPAANARVRAEPEGVGVRMCSGMLSQCEPLLT